MLEALIAIRDFLVMLALSWIGVTAEPVKREPAPTRPSCGAAGMGAMCAHGRPSFDAQECD